MKRNVTPKKILLSLSGIALAAILFFAGYFTFYLTMSREEKYLLWAARRIEDGYTVYDEATGGYKEYTAEEMVKALLAGLPLDRYSAFYSETEYADVVATSRGNQFGAGLTFAVGAEDTLIVSVIGNSPAERAGIEAGGRVAALEYGGARLETDTYAALKDALSRVPANERFALYVSYGGETARYELRRESFRESYVRYADCGTGYLFRGEGVNDPAGAPAEEARMEALGGDTAYISFSSFMYPAADQLAEAMAFMFQRGKSRLIFDLRGNGGGYMDVFAEVAGRFLPVGEEKALAAVAKPKKGKETEFYASENLYDARLKEIVVLADGGTASAAECLIGAMLHYGAIGEESLVIVRGADGAAHTYGKGIMQTTYTHPLFGGALKLTTAYVYLPDGVTCIHGRGIFTAAENEIDPKDGEDPALFRAIEILR